MTETCDVCEPAVAKLRATVSPAGITVRRVVAQFAVGGVLFCWTCARRFVRGDVVIRGLGEPEREALARLIRAEEN